jgi:protein involved in polysaccharide export with SLBB domain
MIRFGMRLKSIVVSGVLFATILLLAGCQSGDATATPRTTLPQEPTKSGEADGSQPRVKSDLLDKATGIDDLSVGDKITVSFSDIPTPPMATEQRIREDGTITLPLGVVINAAGKKAGDLEVEIQKAYVPKYYLRLTVGVKTEERVFYVRGYVRQPGRYPYAGEMTVLKAISVAGDFSDFGSRRRVELTRSDKTVILVDCEKARKDPKLDLPLYPGDSIFVHKRW